VGAVGEVGEERERGEGRGGNDRGGEEREER